MNKLCEFFFTVKVGHKRTYPLCGKPSSWKWKHKHGSVTHYCQEHGDAMRGEGMCADNGKWERLPEVQP